MDGLDIKQAISIIETHKNPEIHHYNHGFHPGSKWYIKTILPMLSLVDEDFHQVVNGWHDFSRKNPHLVRISDMAFHWNGERIPGWNTVWLDERYDIVCETIDGYPRFKLIDHDVGMRQSADRLVGLFNRVSEEPETLSRLDDISSALRTYASKQGMISKRSRIRMV